MRQLPESGARGVGAGAAAEAPSVHGRAGGGGLGRIAPLQHSLSRACTRARRLAAPQDGRAPCAARTAQW
eukprot:4465778-Lingulodinium_polyedra.AAC.1